MKWIYFGKIAFLFFLLLERIRGQVEHRSCSNKHILDALANTLGQLKREERYDTGVEDRDVTEELINSDFCKRVEEDGHRVRPGWHLRRLGCAKSSEIFNQVL